MRILCHETERRSEEAHAGLCESTQSPKDGRLPTKPQAHTALSELAEERPGAQRRMTGLTICRHKDKFEFHAPQGSSVAFPRLTTGEAVEAFCDRVVKESGVFLLPAQVYGHQKSIEEGRFRIGLGRSNFHLGLKALDNYLSKDSPKYSSA